MNRFDADDARDFLVADRNGASGNNLFVNAADRVKAEISLVGNISYNEAHFVHMGGKHDLVFRTLFSFFESNNIPERVNFGFALILDTL